MKANHNQVISIQCNDGAVANITLKEFESKSQLVIIHLVKVEAVANITLKEFESKSQLQMVRAMVVAGCCKYNT